MASAGTEHIVATVAEAEAASEPPLLVLEPVARFLDESGIGSGPITARRIGEGGGSNFSYLLERDGARLVLRRPPRPPLPPSAHDMVREARLQLALAPHGIRLPKIRAVCEDESVLGVPFYVMDFIDGYVVQDDAAGGPRKRGGKAPARARPRRRARRDPRSRRERRGPRGIRPTRKLSRAPGAPVLAAVGDQPHAPLPVVEQVAERLGAEMPGAAPRHRRPRRLPARERDRRRRRPVPDRRRARLGDGRDRRSPCRRRLPPRHVQPRRGPRARSARRP